MLLATLVLENSALGAALTRNRPDAVNVSVYVDDIILSANEEEVLTNYLGELNSAAVTAGFTFNLDKSQQPADRVTAFNCQLETRQLSVEPYRYQQFQYQLVGASEATVSGILSYVYAVNPQQAINLST